MRWWGRAAALGALLSAAVVVPPAASGAATSPWLLDASSTGGTTALLTVAMGQRSNPANTFGEVFALNPSGQLRLVTPTGTATNGGLVLAVDATGRSAAATMPSASLHLTPVAQASPGPGPWKSALLPRALLGAPGSLSEGPLGLFAVTSDGQLLGTKTGWSWAPVHLSAARSVATRCGGTLAAVGQTASRVLVGLSCPRPGTWPLASPAGPVSVAGGGPTGPARCLRVLGTPSGFVALVAISGPRPSLVVLASNDGGNHATVAPLASLTPGQSLRSTAISTSGSVAAVVDGVHGPLLFVRRGGVLTSATLPSGSQVAVFTASGSIETVATKAGAVVVSAPSGSRWVVHQRLSVALPYGSSG